MKEHIEAVRTFMGKAGQNVPGQLTIPTEQELLLRAKLAMEECLELCAALGVTIYPKSMDQEPIESTNDLSFSFNGKVDPVEALDAAVDSLWVSTTGVAAIFGLLDKLEEAVTEVDISNLSKFIDGHKCPETGKWIKGKSYKPADIKGVIFNNEN